jgi:hypothetical protein
MMNAALSNVFLANLPKVIRETSKPICMKQPNTVFLHMFDWFITKYVRTTTEDREANWQRMAATWYPSKGFEQLATHLFIGASYAPLDDHDVIDIGLRIIKRCGGYPKEYKNWILPKNAVLPIIETIKFFKECLANGIAQVNQTAIPALQHGYSMTPLDCEALVALYGDLLANFCAAYAATQETMKSQANHLVTMQNQFANIQQFCMTVGQQPPSSGYTPTKQ